MQHADIYSELNKRTPKYDKIAQVLKDNQHLFQWEPEERILDAGCGPGDMTSCVILPWLPQDFQLLLGADVSPAVIEHALKHNASEKVKFEVLDIAVDISMFLQKQESSAGFNKIFSFYVMQWLRDLRKGVENLYRLLKPGGQMLLLFPADRLFQKTFMKVRSKDPWKQYSKDEERKIPPFLISDNQCEEFKRMLQDIGFETIKCELKKYSTHFDHVEDIKDLAESLDHEIDHVPAELRPEYLQHCYDTLVDMGAVHPGDSGLELTQSMLLVVARRPSQ
ncbi:juvenile hormone acid O-methyltransferase-like [Macrosteles quadrilineatus]|uniref:juvenile hormone acid O-methyltransferase-like n=1 Tax=Macrosteles quadrilineatus TaxID=74068 RepID=UPI0023E220A0|nr:juvenile hormone acid O-methyltransferase-like [Macrosteles quadrilineatus]